MMMRYEIAKMIEQQNWILERPKIEEEKQQIPSWLYEDEEDKEDEIDRCRCN